MSATASNGNYFVWDTDQTAHGPVELPTVISWIRGGRVAGATWIFVVHGGIWERAANLPELKMFFHTRRSGQAAHGKLPHLVLGVEPSTLRRSRLLADFSDEQLERFSRFVVSERFPQAAVVVRQGDCSKAMYLILEGELSVHLNLGGQETELATLGAGDFFGDFALFDHGPRSADVVANRSCHLWKISAESFQQLSREAPDVALPFLRAIGKTQTARIRAGNKRQGETTLMARVLSQPQNWAAEAE
jgi:CRP-like cAMP-binding protein